VEQVHLEMRASATHAVERIGQAKVLTLTTPVRAALRAVPPASLEPLKGVPGIQYQDQTVEFTAADFGAAYDGIVALIGVATRAYPGVLTETIRGRPDGEALLKEYGDRLFARWMDVESGRWTPPSPPTPVAGRKYHGAN
jgi:hypothetical protein